MKMHLQSDTRQDAAMLAGCSKMPRCKVPDVTRSEAYSLYAATTRD